MCFSLLASEPARTIHEKPITIHQNHFELLGVGWSWANQGRKAFQRQIN